MIKPSKSERKREQQRLQSLGEQLLTFDDDLLRSLDLDERLLDALQAAQKMKSHEALRRQKQYIGKLMRDVDAAPIEAILHRLQADDRREKRLFASAEKWRDRILKEGATGVDALFAETGDTACRDELTRLVQALDQSFSDREETEIRRNVFRCIHAALVVAAKDR